MSQEKPAQPKFPVVPLIVLTIALIVVIIAIFSLRNCAGQPTGDGDESASGEPEVSEFARELILSQAVQQLLAQQPLERSRTGT